MANIRWFDEDSGVDTRVSKSRPLPIMDVNSAVEVLARGTAIPAITNTPLPSDPDILGNTDPNSPTVKGTARRRFVLVGWHSAPLGNPTAMTLIATLWGRSSETSGNPLHGDSTVQWEKIGDYVLSTSLSPKYFRVILEPDDADTIGHDAYRITLSVRFAGGSNQSLEIVRTILRREDFQP